MKKSFYITTSIVYATKTPHFGNDSEIVFADAVARYKRGKGFDVFFLTGTDEHGQKVEELAALAGITPKEHVDNICDIKKENYRMLGASYDRFIRTTDKHHEEAVAKMFNKLYENGDIYKGEYEGMYCVPCESFYTPSQISSPGICPDCGATLRMTKESAYFLRLSKYQERLERYIEENEGFIYPVSRRNEMINNFLKPGLQDLCVSRSTIKWGVPVEFDPEHVIYVWVDALPNYITGLGYNPDKEPSEDFIKYWPCDLHVIGKDIVRFHTIYWPVILMALGLELPKRVIGRQWLLMGDDKMSKSKGNTLYTRDIVERFGTDAVRYYLLREMGFGSDLSFTYENFINRYNADLANTLGNLVSRTAAMVGKYFGGTLPARGKAEAIDDELRAVYERVHAGYTELMDQYRVSEALEECFTLLHRANKYIDETCPWILAKDEEKRGRLGTVLYNLTESIRLGALMLLPAIPGSAERILEIFGAADCRSDEFGAITPGKPVAQTEALFVRLEQMTYDEEPAAAEAAPVPEKLPEISYDDFMKTDLRAALVTGCEKAPKSDKLLVLQLDLGYEKRQVVSGIAEFYKPEDLIGKKVVLVSNLKPVKLRGILSEGMILAGGEDDVKVIFADGAEIGSRVR